MSLSDIFTRRPCCGGAYAFVSFPKESPTPRTILPASLLQLYKPSNLNVYCFKRIAVSERLFPFGWVKVWSPFHWVARVASSPPAVVAPVCSRCPRSSLACPTLRQPLRNEFGTVSTGEPGTPSPSNSEHFCDRQISHCDSDVLLLHFKFKI